MFLPNNVRALDRVKRKTHHNKSELLRRWYHFIEQGLAAAVVPKVGDIALL
jgi:hypothetical protein